MDVNVSEDKAMAIRNMELRKLKDHDIGKRNFILKLIDKLEGKARVAAIFVVLILGVSGGIGLTAVTQSTLVDLFSIWKGQPRISAKPLADHQPPPEAHQARPQLTTRNGP